jgi:hypothetical protein
MIRMLDGMGVLTMVIARRLRPEIRRLKQQIEEYVEAVDGFYAVLGSRHWILHESLGLDLAREVMTLPPAQAEQKLVEHYRDPEALRPMIRRVRNHPAMRPRNHLLKRAENDFLERRYYSTVLLLLTVMDGFVNDIDQQQRRGLHTRTPDEMAAWDSVVGHHMALANAHQTFIKGFYKTSDEEVHDLYRNGIVHGMLTNFDNELVAAKAWNRLFAVGDWATSLEKAREPLIPPVGVRDLIAGVQENRQLQAELDAWSPSRLHADDQGFTEHPVYRAAEAFLMAWEKGNYGRMAELLARNSLGYHENVGKAAGDLRGQYEFVELAGFDLRELDFVAASICVVRAHLTCDGHSQPAWLRWIHEDDNGAPVVDGGAGAWKVMSWGPSVLFNEPEPAEE